MELTDTLIKKGVLKNPRLIEAFRVVDRKNFVPEEFKDYAYVDAPLSLGEGQTISQPWTVAFMLELLCGSSDAATGRSPDGCVGNNIMEIGYGSGWVTALMAHCGANVYAIERIRELCKFGKENFEKFFNLPSDPLLGKEGRGEVRFFCQDGTLGLPEIAEKIGGFDKIIVAAAASTAPTSSVGAAINSLPKAWRDQLKAGGKIVAPIGHSIFEFVKKGDASPVNPAGKFDEREHPGFAFVPLVADRA